VSVAASTTSSIISSVPLGGEGAEQRGLAEVASTFRISAWKTTMMPKTT
jgi:hypothetical protein